MSTARASSLPCAMDRELFPAAEGKPLVAIGNYDFRASGTVRKSIEIAEALHLDGINTALWAIRAQGAMMENIPAHIPVRIINPVMASRKSREHDLLANTRRFAAFLRQEKPALLLSGGNHFHLPSRLALQISGRRAITTLLTRASNASLKNSEASSLGAALKRQAERFKYSASDLTVAVSEELSAQLSTLGIAHALHTIPNGVPIAEILRQSHLPYEHPFCHDRDAKLLVSVGRLHPQKGYDILLAALARINAVRPANLLIVGDGNNSYRQELERLAGKLGLGHRIDFTGYEPHPARIVARADIFINSSRWEGASNSLLEALACGTAVVATDCPTGNREILALGPVGRLAKNGNAQSLAHTVLTEMATQRNRAVIREIARKRDLPACLNAWVRLISATLQRTQAQRTRTRIALA